MSNSQTPARRRARRRAAGAANQAQLPQVPTSVHGRVLCAHPELLTIPLAFLLIFGFYSSWLVVGLTAVSVGLFAWGWPWLLDNPVAGGRKSAWLAILGWAALGLCTYYLDFSFVPIVAALGVVGGFVLELSRKERSELVPSLAVTLGGVLLVTPGASWIILQNDDLWRLLYIPAGVLMLGACLGMTVSYSWSARGRTFAVAGGALVFALVTGVVMAVLQRLSAPKVALLTGGFVPSVWLTVFCTLALGLVVGAVFALMCYVFGGPTGAGTVRAALAGATTPILLCALPFYVLARLLVDTAQVW